MPDCIIHHGDNLSVLKQMIEDGVQIDACLMDGPYGLRFMNKKWDYDVPTVEFWRLVLQVLKPGGHVLSFGSPRTQHRMVVNIEDAGFEIRDQIVWIYGCLSDDTEILVDGRWESYKKALFARMTLGYNPITDEFSWQPILNTFRYEVRDMVYRIQSALTDQIVSRNHRCLIERNDKLIIQTAESIALERDSVAVPVIENLIELLDALPVPADREVPARISGSSYITTIESRITPFYCIGTVWCVEVPTGCFVARRNGKVFITGNSGFPKSRDIAKDIDSLAGAEREVVAPPPYTRGKAGQSYSDTRKVSYDCEPQPITAPATDDAKTWQGYGSALKPSHECICLARKPLGETSIAANVLKYGVGAININACRIVASGRPLIIQQARDTKASVYEGRVDGSLAGGSKAVGTTDKGRWPSNTIISNDDEVLALFPESSVTGKRSQQSQNAEVKGTKWLESNHKSAEYTDSGPASRFFYCASDDATVIATDVKDSEAPLPAIESFDPTESVCGAENQPANGRVGEASAETRYTENGSTNFAALPGERRFDKGSVSRYFYQAKASKAERISRILYDIHIAWTSELGQHEAALLVDMDVSPPMVTVVSGLGGREEWSMFLFGNNIAEQYLQDIKYITKTKLNSTTKSTIWNLLMRSLTNESIVVANCEMVNGGSLVENAQNGSKCLRITTNVTNPAYAPGVNNAASRMQFSINVKEKQHSHPTQKPLMLMRYLCRLITPAGGTILDPFAGSGTTGEAAVLEGFNAILIEREAEFIPDIERRIQRSRIKPKPDTRKDEPTATLAEIFNFDV